MEELLLLSCRFKIFGILCWSQLRHKESGKKTSAGWLFHTFCQETLWSLEESNCEKFRQPSFVSAVRMTTSADFSGADSLAAQMSIRPARAQQTGFKEEHLGCSVSSKSSKPFMEVSNSESTSQTNPSSCWTATSMLTWASPHQGPKLMAASAFYGLSQEVVGGGCSIYLEYFSSLGWRAHVKPHFFSWFALSSEAMRKTLCCFITSDTILQWPKKSWIWWDSELTMKAHQQQSIHALQLVSTSPGLLAQETWSVSSAVLHT